MNDASLRTLLFGPVAVGVVAIAVLGCRALPPGGAPITPMPLGSVVDEANRLQEDNAEAAKFIVYCHEFELNKPFELPAEYTKSKQYEGIPEFILRGFRLNPHGQDHVKRIAYELGRGTFSQVVVERSETSRQWITKFRFPVHWNSQLDEHRRQIVIDSLRVFGIQDPESIVVIAPAYPFGLDAGEAGQAYQQSLFNNSGGGGGGFGGGGLGGGGGGFGGGGF